MADHSTIEWTDATWNPITGCSIVSPGCTNCYAMRLAGTRLKRHPSRAGLTVDSKAGPVWNGQVRLNEGWLTQPLEWKRPRMIFVCAHGDLFAEAVPDEWIDRVFAVMALSPQHTFQVLTKRAKRMREYLAASQDRIGGIVFLNALRGAGSVRADDWRHAKDRPWPLPNVWLGVSAERQQEADERVPELLATPAAIRFVSAEPLLGPIDFTALRLSDAIDIDRGDYVRLDALEHLDWIIVGGESGQDARPMHPAWARSIRDQCTAAGVPFFFKQWGEWLPIGQSGFHYWSAANIRNNGIGMRWLGQAHFNDGARGPETHSIGPVETQTVLTAGEHMGTQCVRLGKKRAGRLLDGAEHNGMPAPREVPAL